MVAAAEWYEVGNFWVAVAAIAVSIIIGGLSLLASYRSSLPNRRIVYRYDVEQLSPSVAGLEQTLTTHHHGRIVTSPHVVHVAIGNEGRRDVPSSSFDCAQPLVIRSSNPILEVVHHKSKPAGRAGPAVKVSGTEVSIGPSLLASRQILILGLLVEGRPNLSFSNPLIDVPLLDSKDVMKKRKRFSGILKLASLATATVAVILPVLLDLRNTVAVPMVLLGLLFATLSTFAEGISGRIFGGVLVRSNGGA